MSKGNKNIIRHLIFLISLNLVVIMPAILLATPTPTLTPTLTTTIVHTPTVTPTDIIVEQVKISCNRFNPNQAERVEINKIDLQHGKVTIKVLTQAGKEVKILIKDELVNKQTIIWNGRNNQNQIVASGVYIIVVTGDRLYRKFRVAVIKD